MFWPGDLGTRRRKPIYNIYISSLEDIFFIAFRERRERGRERERYQLVAFHTCPDWRL